MLGRHWHTRSIQEMPRGQGLSSEQNKESLIHVLLSYMDMEGSQTGNELLGFSLSVLSRSGNVNLTIVVVCVKCEWKRVGRRGQEVKLR